MDLGHILGSSMTSIFFKDPHLNIWKLVSLNYDRAVARSYATALRTKGYEAFASNRAIYNHYIAVLKRFKYAEI